MTTGDIPEVLRAPARAGAARFPWPAPILGACTALRGGRLTSTRAGRLVAVVAAVPLTVVELSAFPGSGRLLSRVSPVGQLAYGEGVAALGYQFTSVGSTAVRIDWEERPVAFRLVSEGILFSRVQVNDREVFVDRRCGRALEKLWTHG